MPRFAPVTPTFTSASLEEPVTIAPGACEGCCHERAEYKLMMKN